MAAMTPSYWQQLVRILVCLIWATFATAFAAAQDPAQKLGRVISSAELVAAGEQAVWAQLGLHPEDRATVAPVAAPAPVLAPEGQIAIEAAARRPALRGGLWVAEVAIHQPTHPSSGRSESGWSLTTTIRYRVRVSGPVLVTRVPIRRHHLLQDREVAREVRDLTAVAGEPVRSIEELDGRRAARAAPAGAVVSSDWLEPIPTVQRGEVLAVRAQVGGVIAWAAGAALSEGCVGELIRVRQEDGRGELSARVIGPGRAEVVTAQ